MAIKGIGTTCDLLNRLLEDECNGFLPVIYNEMNVMSFTNSLGIIIPKCEKAFWDKQ